MALLTETVQGRKINSSGKKKKKSQLLQWLIGQLQGKVQIEGSEPVSAAAGLGGIV